LLHFSTEWRPPKAWAPPPSLFFDAFHVTPKQVNQ
jgi:hypothetical protein